MPFLDPTAQFHSFHHATIQSVHIGPRAAVTLILLPLLWNGSQGYYGKPLEVRLSAIETFERVRRYFEHLPERELASLRLDPNQRSSRTHLFVLFVFERTGVELSVECRGFSICEHTEFSDQVQLHEQEIDSDNFLDSLAAEIRTVFRAPYGDEAHFGAIHLLVEHFIDKTKNVSLHDKKYIADRLLFWNETQVIGKWKPSYKVMKKLKDTIFTLHGYLEIET